MATATECVACELPLSLDIYDDEDEEDVEMGESSAGGPSIAANTVPDDVHLICGCHFHWQCLLDAYTVTECPKCSKPLTITSPTGTQVLLVQLHNEGGFQQDLDILPLLAEESYLKAYPEERKSRAFLEFCREGDVQAIIDMLRPDIDSDNDEEEIEVSPQDLLKYQDAIGDGSSGLHAAVAAHSREVAWLLLLLASNLHPKEFPAEVLHEAEALQIQRGIVDIDIRGLRNKEGKTAEDLAREIGGVWEGWVDVGRLSATSVATI
ncbi:Conidiophore development protein [Venturia nashicola]|uniref:Conidiophore development protein n=1 Tax=Venturia nashicola TaxID=86259 RepID=A0A4Z1P6P0_9PEZI|nr:Conidiophore development protein [Venturia nashicola]